jgi:hypothetical protein
LDGSGGGDRSVGANDAGDDGDGDNLVVTDTSPPSATDSSPVAPPCGSGVFPSAGQIKSADCRDDTFVVINVSFVDAKASS